ncbi:RNA-directed DNA polymerase, eukaryota, reverse transcriptase zinc-binding domain protein [Tanacetum coccineum]
MWGKYGIAKIDKWENGCYMFKFRDDKGMNDVLEKGHWMVNNKPLFVQKWSSEIGMHRVEPKKMPIWVKITNVHLEAWCVKGISALTSSLGKHILMDTMTANMCHKGIGNLGYARVLVKIDAAKDLKNEIKIQYIDKSNNIKGRVVTNGNKGTQDVEKVNKNVEESRGVQQDRNAKFMVQGKRKSYRNDYSRPGAYANTKNNLQNQRQINHAWRTDRHENSKKEYKKRKTDVENNVKNKENNNVKSNKWKVKDNVVEEIRNTTNKYYVLDSLHKDNDQKLRILKERIIVDKILNEKLQPTLRESITWSKDMIEYFKEKWEGDKLKERNAENEADEMEDVLEINNGTTKVTRANEISGDLNVTLQPNEHSCGSTVMTSDMMEFQGCLNKIKVEDICISDLHFTWTKNLQRTKTKNMIRILKKLDIVMYNEEFIKQFPNSHAKVIVGINTSSMGNDWKLKGSVVSKQFCEAVNCFIKAGIY